MRMIQHEETKICLKTSLSPLTLTRVSSPCGRSHNRANGSFERVWPICLELPRPLCQPGSIRSVEGGANRDGRVWMECVGAGGGARRRWSLIGRNFKTAFAINLGEWRNEGRKCLVVSWGGEGRREGERLGNGQVLVTGVTGTGFKSLGIIDKIKRWKFSVIQILVIWTFRYLCFFFSI